MPVFLTCCCNSNIFYYTCVKVLILIRLLYMYMVAQAQKTTCSCLVSLWQLEGFVVKITIMTWFIWHFSKSALQRVLQEQQNKTKVRNGRNQKTLQSKLKVKIKSGKAFAQQCACVRLLRLCQSLGAPTAIAQRCWHVTGSNTHSYR